jgi:hypothetical protein
MGAHSVKTSGPAIAGRAAVRALDTPTDAPQDDLDPTDEADADRWTAEEEPELDVRSDDITLYT